MQRAEKRKTFSTCSSKTLFRRTLRVRKYPLKKKRKSLMMITRKTRFTNNLFKSQLSKKRKNPAKFFSRVKASNQMRPPLTSFPKPIPLLS